MTADSPDTRLKTTIIEILAKDRDCFLPCACEKSWSGPCSNLANEILAALKPAPPQTSGLTADNCSCSPRYRPDCAYMKGGYCIDQSTGLREALDEAWKLLDIAYSAHQKLGFEGQGARGLPHETRMFAAEFSKPEEPKTPEHTILSGTGRYQKWRQQTKAALAAQSPVLPPSGVESEPNYAMRGEIADAIRDFRASLSPGAVRDSHGTDRIYYSGIPFDGLVDAIFAALSTSVAGEADTSWSRIDKELSAYVETVRKDLIEKCVAEALRCDTHAMFCEADPKTIRKGIASRIGALLVSPALDPVTERLVRVDASLARQLSESIALNSKLKIENERLRAIASPALDPGTVEACAKICERAALRCVREQTPGDSVATFCAQQVRALASPAPGGE